MHSRRILISAAALAIFSPVRCVMDDVRAIDYAVRALCNEQALMYGPAVTGFTAGLSSTLIDWSDRHVVKRSVIGGLTTVSYLTLIDVLMRWRPQPAHGVTAFAKSMLNPSAPAICPTARAEYAFLSYLAGVGSGYAIKYLARRFWAGTRAVIRHARQDDTQQKSC